MPSSDHLRPRLNREILGRVLLFLWFRSIGAAKSDLNLCANSVNLFLREPLVHCSEVLVETVPIMIHIENFDDFGT